MCLGWVAPRFLCGDGAAGRGAGGRREGEGEKGMLRGVIENFFPLKILRIWPLKILRIWPGRWCSGTRREREEGGRGRERKGGGRE